MKFIAYKILVILPLSESKSSLFCFTKFEFDFVLFRFLLISFVVFFAVAALVPDVDGVGSFYTHRTNIAVSQSPRFVIPAGDATGNRGKWPLQCPASKG